MIPPEADGEFVARMEDICDLYEEKFSATRPVVCMDEVSRQLVGEAKRPLPAIPGHPRRVDYEYRRKGTVNIFVFVQPRKGWRMVKVTNRRTKNDWGLVICELLEKHFKKAKKIRLVLDNLNTHMIGSLYEAFEAPVARRMAKRIEVHYTPKHASWLNMAENEIGVLVKQCLNRRIEDPKELKREIEAWEKKRNQNQVKINWKFTVEMARVKLRKVYPLNSQK